MNNSEFNFDNVQLVIGITQLFLFVCDIRGSKDPIRGNISFRSRR